LNYDFYLDTNEPILLLEDRKVSQDLRPHVGDTIQLPNSTKLYDIRRSEPTGNPAGEKVTYYLWPHEDKAIKDNPQEQIEQFY